MLGHHEAVVRRSLLVVTAQHSSPHKPPLQACCPVVGCAAPGTVPASTSTPGTWKISQAWTACTNSRWSGKEEGAGVKGQGLGHPESLVSSKATFTGED